MWLMLIVPIVLIVWAVAVFNRLVGLRKLADF